MLIQLDHAEENAGEMNSGNQQKKGEGRVRCQSPQKNVFFIQKKP
jgi:hypothetical protein